MNQQLPPKIIDGLDEALLALNLLTIVKHSPFRPRAIESEVDELPGEFTLALFEFFNVGRQPQRAPCRVVRLIALSGHRQNFFDLKGSLARLKLVALECLSVARTYSAFCLFCFATGQEAMSDSGCNYKTRR